MAEVGENVALFVRFLLAAVLLTAGAAKAAAPRNFEKVLRELDPVPQRYAGLLSLWLPRLELISGFLLLIGLWVQVIAASVTLLLVVFSVVLINNLLTGRQIECGCFGAASHRKMTWLSVVRNLLLAVSAGGLTLNPQQPLTVDSLFSDGSWATTETDALFYLAAATSVMASFLLASALKQAAQPAANIRRFMKEESV